ncbi:hypothetical protein UPYG_G00003280 [Umbra pygmaea]|uniref:Ig-like domain-containing protein n=1 Tax=Umbra pygmaea TaxID=75934 RepID=A0ABD0XGU6_UMBPY
MKDLKIQDTGAYWVGIDQINSDVMTSIHLTATLEAVSKPEISPLSSILSSCWGQPVKVRCASAKGSIVKYTWYQHSESQNIQFQSSAELQLHCGVLKDTQYYCEASNDVSSQYSEMVFLKILRGSEEDCVYSINIDGKTRYDCGDRLKTSTSSPLKTTTSHSGIRAWTGLPVWYEVLRWVLLTTLITTNNQLTASTCVKLQKCLQYKGGYLSEEK